MPPLSKNPRNRVSTGYVRAIDAGVRWFPRPAQGLNGKPLGNGYTEMDLGPIWDRLFPVDRAVVADLVEPLAETVAGPPLDVPKSNEHRSDWRILQVVD